MAHILLLEGNRTNAVSFADQLGKRCELLIAHTGKTALQQVKNTLPQVCILDAASMRTSGDRLSHILRGNLQQTPIIHIKTGSAQDQHHSAANLLLYMPLTYRKLWKYVEGFLKTEPESTLRAGGFALNLSQGWLTTPQGETKLTPKLTKMMEIFLRQAGQLVDRPTLMHEVWQTDYLGDTRTLDVHMRWLRQKIEADPNQPQFIKTVRGKGYMLMV